MTNEITSFFTSAYYIPALLVGILVLGFICQWLAWKMKLPAILFLLIVGILLGPGSQALFGPEFQVLQPSLLFKKILYPLVSICVSIILFEGCMNLKFLEIKGTGGTVLNIITLGLWHCCSLICEINLPDFRVRKQFSNLKADLQN